MDVQMILLVAVFLIKVDCAQSQDQVTVSFILSPATIIEDTSDVLLSCQVSGGFNDETDTVRILQAYNGLFIMIATELGKEQTAPDNVEFDGWANNILTVYIRNIIRSNGGEYTCEASRLVTPPSGYQNLDQAIVTVDVLYPASGLPVCETSPTTVNSTWYNGDEITLRCTSDAGNPVVSFKWSNNKGVQIPDVDTQLLLPNSAVSASTVSLHSNHSGIVFNCFRLNIDFPDNQQSCSIGPLTVIDRPLTSSMQTIPENDLITTMTTGISSDAANEPSTSQSGVIAAVVVVIIIIITIIIIVVFLFRTGRCESTLNSNKNNPRAENVSLESGYNNGKAPEDHSHDNPATNVQHILSPNGGQVYAVVQKNLKPQSESASSAGVNSKVYPAAPNYPRPEKPRKSEDEHEHYANARIASGESPANGTLDNSQEKVISTVFPKTSYDDDKPEMALYANASEVAPSVSQEHPPPKVSPVREDKSDMAIYANAADVISDNTPAPREAPSVPSDGTITSPMANTPELDYADLDLTRPASLKSVSGDGNIISNDDQVVYASVNK